MRRLIPFLTTLSLFSADVLAQPDPVDLTIVGPEGWGVQILHGGPGSLPPVVLQGDEVLYPGHLDCGLAQGHPQCRSLNLLLGEDSPSPVLPPEVIVIQAGAGASLLGVTISTYPPPVVVVNGCLVTYRIQDGGCWPGPNDVHVVDASGEIILIHNMNIDSVNPLVVLNDEVLGSPGMDCEQIGIGDWRCELPSGGWLTWRDSESGPVDVNTDFGGVFIDFTVSDAPPPIVYKDGNVMNR